MNTIQDSEQWKNWKNGVNILCKNLKHQESKDGIFAIEAFAIAGGADLTEFLATLSLYITLIQMDTIPDRDGDGQKIVAFMRSLQD